MQPQQPSLEQQVKSLQEENRDLRSQLDSIKRKEEVVKDARKRLLRGGFRILVPLLDRQKVVRSFGKLAQTTSGFAGPREDWPSQDQILADAREFMESCVRFVIRRRTVMLIFSLLAMLVPGIQIWLVVQQNEIMSNQNEISKVQLYDMVATSMTEGNRNARRITGALLANSNDPEFLKGIVEEIFRSDFWAQFRENNVVSINKGIEDATFRSHLIQAVGGGIHVQHKRRSERGVNILGLELFRESDTMSDRDVFDTFQPMLKQIFEDSAMLLPRVLNSSVTENINDEMTDNMDYYIYQNSKLLRTYSRLANTVREEEQFYRDIQPFLSRLSTTLIPEQNRFEKTYRSNMQDFFFEHAQGLDLDAPEETNLESRGLTPDKAIEISIQKLRNGIGANAVNWSNLRNQVEFR